MGKRTKWVQLPLESISGNSRPNERENKTDAQLNWKEDHSSRELKSVHHITFNDPAMADSSLSLGQVPVIAPLLQTSSTWATETSSGYTTLASSRGSSRPLTPSSCSSSYRPVIDPRLSLSLYDPQTHIHPQPSRPFDLSCNPLPIRRPVMKLPTPGKVYYLPDGIHFPDSVIHGQKRQTGFFKHPILVTGLDGKHAQFYALTKAPPPAIEELRMCLRLGGTARDEGRWVLRLAKSSHPMKHETWVNLEQRFYIEWHNLDEWRVEVCIDPRDLSKIGNRVEELEADQNRYLYKPLPRDLTDVQPGTVLMLLNPSGSSTLGAPILILRNESHRVRFLRVKALSNNINFGNTMQAKNARARNLCLEICKHLKIGHDGTPVMLLELGSPEMRETSYVEISENEKWTGLDQCKTWCWPPVKVQAHSIRLLWEYMRRLQTTFKDAPTASELNSLPSFQPSTALSTLAPLPYPHVHPERSARTFTTYLEPKKSSGPVSHFNGSQNPIPRHVKRHPNFRYGTSQAQFDYGFLSNTYGNYGFKSYAYQYDSITPSVRSHISSSQENGPRGMKNGSTHNYPSAVLSSAQVNRPHITRNSQSYLEEVVLIDGGRTGSEARRAPIEFAANGGMNEFRLVKQ